MQSYQFKNLKVYEAVEKKTANVKRNFTDYFRINTEKTTKKKH